MTIQLRIDTVLRSDRGRHRERNQDFVAQKEPAGAEDEARDGWLYVLADGAGGMEAGEVASRYATERTIYHYLANHGERDWGQRLRAAMEAANTDLRELAAEQGQSNRMATTMVAVVFQSRQAILGNVGDSRGYLWHDGVLRQVTKDQSLVAKLVEEGIITAEEAVNHPRKNIILGSLGADSSPKIDLYNLELAGNDVLFLCSDGLTRHVSDEEIAHAIGEDGEAAADHLIGLANERGGEDNISVAILRYTPLVTTESNTAATAASTATSLPLPEASGRRWLWMYTAVLGLAQIILTVLVWLLLQI
ncbi:MAG: PP2C family serine/threonine-protein phosphatase [Chloroflexota bacterium]